MQLYRNAGRARFSATWLFLAALAGASAARAQPRLYSQETSHFRVVYYSPAHEYLAPLLIRSLENSLRFYERTFGYVPKEQITVLIQDFEDYGYGSAGTLPRNFIQIGIEPFNLVFETLPAAERIGLMSTHELGHVVIGDKPSSRDARFRTIFRGKIMPNADDPLSIPFSFLASPRQYSPRWFHEGTATFLETWTGGGLGRALGGYDEMVFRGLVRDQRYIYELVGLESEGTAADFQVGANSYLYGTRFLNALVIRYGPEKLLEWISRQNGGRAYFESEFQRVYGVSLRDEWRRWIAGEREWQSRNLAKIREYPVTKPQRLSEQPLGSVSRSYYDPVSRVIYAAVRHPGRLAYLAAIHPDTGRIEHLTDVEGSALYYVTSLTFDAAGRRLFFTTNNNALRALRVYSLDTKRTELLSRNIRTGDLVFNGKDQSLWGIRHADGLSSIVLLNPPYRVPQVLYTFPYSEDIGDIDLSPDGEYLVGTLVDLTGRQTLARFRTSQLRDHNGSSEPIYNFEFNSPGGFVYSTDGHFLYGSSYATGASNLFRIDLSSNRLEALSNSETGLFRPLPLPDGSIAAFEYSSRGFVPVRMPVTVLEDVNAIPYLGQTAVENFSALRSWRLPSRGEIDDLSLRTYAGEYKPFRSMRLSSMYPIVQGYKSSPAGGMRFDFADALSLSRASATLSVSPDTTLPLKERFHGSIEAAYWDWSISAYFNRADFYDLFGPTKVSRRGFGALLERRKNLIYDAQRRLDLDLSLAGYSGLDRLPDYQNVVASHPRFVRGAAALEYSNLQRTLGAVEDEKGSSWSLHARAAYTGSDAFPNLWATYDRGFLTPFRNSSLWVRSSAGRAFGNSSDPFANYYFGGFGNNWVDKGDFSRYRAWYSFPGVRLNAIGAHDFVKTMVEWNLPPVRFRAAGGTRLYFNWARLSLFSGVLGANPGSAAQRAGYLDAGAQLNLRLVWFTYLNSTFSVGVAAARDPNGRISSEKMISLKIN